VGPANVQKFWGKSNERDNQFNRWEAETGTSCSRGNVVVVRESKSQSSMPAIQVVRSKLSRTFGLGKWADTLAPSAAFDT
jgi:hypothetical protein